MCLLTTNHQPVESGKPGFSDLLIMLIKALKLVTKDWILGILLTVVVLGCFVYEVYPLRALEYKAYDLLSTFRQQEDSDDVVVVAIDDKSIEKMGPWPWPRDHIADMVTRLSKYGAGVVGIQVLYPNRELNPGLIEIRKIRKGLKDEKNKRIKAIYKSLRNAERKIDSDRKLLKAIKSSGNVVLPMVFSLGSAEDVDESKDKKIPKFLKAASIVLSPPQLDMKRDLRELRNPLHHSKNHHLIANDVVTPFDNLSGGAGALGHINSLADRDGVIRGHPLFIEYRGRFYPSFALQTALKYLKCGLSDIEQIEVRSRIDGLGVKDLTIPTSHDYRMLVSYRDTRAFPVFSFSDVLAGDVPAETFKDRIVLVGRPTGNGTAYKSLSDLSLPGVALTANVVRNIIKSNHLMRPAWSFGLEVGVLLYFGIIIALILPRVKLHVGGLIIGLSLLPWLSVVAFLFISSGYWLMAASPTLLLVFGYSLTVLTRFLASAPPPENIELNKMLGLTFQSKGMLDMALEKFMKCPVRDNSVKDLLYNLSLDFERKRMFGKARAVYEHILKAGKFRDIKKKIEMLRAIGEPGLITLGSAHKGSTMLLDKVGTKPTLGRYEVLKELGRGAMGTVYLGRDPKINRDVAIKTLVYEEIETDQLEEIKKRFSQEAEAAGKLSHPNIITIYDAGNDHDLAYLAMELLEGKNLSAHCRKESLLPLKEVVRIVASVANALDYAHKNGVVHRDIKPGNIMLLNDGSVKVMDFGIAKVMESTKTRTGMVLGTPSYMSPEQVDGKRVNGASDLFSLGSVFYELVSGYKTFKGDNLNTLMYNISKCSYTPPKDVAPEIPDCCETIIKKLLTKSLQDRYKTGGEVLKDIDLCMKGLG